MSCGKRKQPEFVWPKKQIMNENSVIVVSDFKRNQFISPLFFLKGVGSYQSEKKFYERYHSSKNIANLLNDENLVPLEFIERFDRSQYLLSIEKPITINKSFQLYYIERDNSKPGKNNFKEIESLQHTLDVVEKKAKKTSKINSFQFVDYNQGYHHYLWKFKYKSNNENHIALVRVTDMQNQSQSTSFIIPEYSNGFYTITLGTRACEWLMPLQGGVKNKIQIKIMDEFGNYSNKEEVILSPKSKIANGL